jgi:P27 family predicted phage terminase small subunit
MPAGRPKIPQGMKDLAGTSRADRTNDSAPIVKTAPPPRPAFLDDDPQAAQLYDVVVSTLLKLGVVGEPDSVALSLLADQLSRYLEYREIVRREGYTQEGARGGAIAHPLLTHMSSTYTNIHKMLCQYGLTAATRDNVNANMPVGDGTPDAPAAFDAFLGRKS